jgi:hypothetical protein
VRKPRWTAARAGRQFRRGLADEVPHVLDAIANRTAEQIHEGLAARFANDVPARGFDGGNSRTRCPHVVPAAHGIHALQYPLDVEWILADHQLLKRADDGHHNVGRWIAAGLAESCDSFVGFDFQNHVGDSATATPRPLLFGGEGDGHQGSFQCGNAHELGLENGAAN